MLTAGAVRTAAESRLGTAAESTALAAAAGRATAGAVTEFADGGSLTAGSVVTGAGTTPRLLFLGERLTPEGVRRGEADAARRDVESRCDVRARRLSASPPAPSGKR